MEKGKYNILNFKLYYIIQGVVMRRLVIIDQDGNSIKNDIFEKLFDIRESEIERKLEVRESFIKENNLKDITHDDVIAEIQAISNIDSMQKEKILDMIDKLLENRSRIQSFDCKLYYESGIQDVIGILFREKSY